MQFTNRSIINEVAQLTMPHPQDVVVSHGAALVIRGLRAEHVEGDIDIITCSKNIEYLEVERGFTQAQRTVGDDAGEPRLVTSYHDPAHRFDVHLWDFSTYNHVRIGTGELELNECKVMSDEDPHTGMYIAQLSYVVLTKQLTGRPQDEADIRLIEQHIVRCEKA